MQKYQKKKKKKKNKKKVFNDVNILGTMLALMHKIRQAFFKSKYFTST